MRLKFLIAYDGPAFSGWQSQAHGGAVQDAIESALASIAGHRIVLHGSGRTDAGVHALGQCAHADVPDDKMKPTDWQRALNAHIPPGVRVLRATRAAKDFHARFSARGKIYRYLVRNQPVLPPHEAGRVAHVPRPLNLETLSAVAKSFAGRHNFSAFSANRGMAVRDPHRTIHRVQVSQRGTLLTLTFEGEGFLYKMVRMMVGAALRAGEGREPVDAIFRRLSDGQPRWNHVAPAEGLYLVRVLY